MLSVTEVVGKARTHLSEAMPEFAKLEPKVEELVRSQDPPRWEVTFRAGDPVDQKVASLADLLSRQKVVKVVSLDGSDGSLIAVRDPAFSSL